MADIINFPNDESDGPEKTSEAKIDRFLADEGLELLAAYRAIGDRAIRASVMDLIVTLAARNCAKD